MNSQRIVIAGGGAAGVFAALACADAGCASQIVVLEKGREFLSKVRISGGGRCNVTHACFDEREFAARFPRGARELIGPLKQFQARDTVAWFAARGVQLRTENDGRMFPVTNSSQTIVECLIREARNAGVELIANCGVEGICRRGDGFELTLSRSAVSAEAGGTVRNDRQLFCDRVLLATGGCRAPALGQIAVLLGHTLEPPVPSLFTFNVEASWLRNLSGISVERVKVSVPGTKLSECGPVLVTHWGLSGPAILRLSAWGARELHDRNYRFALRVNWLPEQNEESLASEFQRRRESEGSRPAVKSPLAPLPSRLWEQLVLASGIPPETRWATLSRAAQSHLIRQLLGTELPVTGKSLNKDEFVTCGGVRLSEVNLKTMESRVCPGLYFAGEVLDIDGITGGFNFQAAWTTGWIAGRSLAACSRLPA